MQVGDTFWALEMIRYEPCGDPVHWHVVGETKTLWKIKRVDYPEGKPTPTPKDMTEWFVITSEQAQKIAWMRKHENAVVKAVEHLTSAVFRNQWERQVNNYGTLRRIADVVGYKE